MPPHHLLINIQFICLCSMCSIITISHSQPSLNCSPDSITALMIIRQWSAFLLYWCNNTPLWTPILPPSYSYYSLLIYLVPYFQYSFLYSISKCLNLLLCFLCDFILYLTFIPSLLVSTLWSLSLSLVLDCHSTVTCYLHQAYPYNKLFLPIYSSWTAQPWRQRHYELSATDSFTSQTTWIFIATPNTLRQMRSHMYIFILPWQCPKW